MAIKDANSEDDLFAQYEQKTGDNSYSEEDKIINIMDIFHDTQNKPIPYNVMANRHGKSVDKQIRHTGTSKDSNAKSKLNTNSRYNEKPKYCSNCGSKLVTQGAKFCSQCGKKILS